MANPIHSFNELKRRIYLFALPAVLLATAVSVYVVNLKKSYGPDFYFYMAFILLFTFGWFLVYKRKYIILFEYTLMAVTVFYYLSMLTLEVIHNVGRQGEVYLSSIIIWMPIIIMLFFMVLRRKKALIAASILLIVSMVPGIWAYTDLNISFRQSLFQLYVATVLYIGVLYFSFNMFLAYAENIVLRQQYYLDTLTQIANRNQIDEWMENLISDAKTNDCFSILFFDIDYFKSVNDRFGHSVGDSVLKQAAEIIRSELNEGQLFGRWGGEEFSVLVKTSEANAIRLAERLRDTIETHSFGDIGTITASFGVTGFRIGDTIESIFKRCDERLYLSKKNGRNRVTGNMTEKM